MGPYRGEAEGISGVLVCPQTKSSEPLRTAVSAEVLEAGKRLLARGSFSFEQMVGPPPGSGAIRPEIECVLRVAATDCPVW